MTVREKNTRGIIHIPVLVLVVVALVTLFVLSPVEVKDSSGLLGRLVSPKEGDEAKEEIIEEKEEEPKTEVLDEIPEPTPQTPSPSPSPAPTLTPATPAPLTSAPSTSGHSRFTIATQRGNFLIDLVSIDMAGVRVITDTASDNDCGDGCPTIPLADFVTRNGGFAGINGTYFCPATYGECAGKSNSFDFPVYNSRLNKWINAGNLFWNNRSIFYFDGGGVHFLRNANSFGGGLSAGAVNHPGLLEGGAVIADQFGLSEKQSSKGTKSGIGIRGNVIYLVVARSVDMLDLAHVFKTLGASQALNLDGGGSSALWFGGYKAGPGRNLPNAIIFAR